ncbi:MAG: glycoside hydrolase family 3 N-terminal domain-containing protein, partial [Acutalibacteraceae bacterium]
SIMIGHIMQPAFSRALRPGIKDEEIMPATVAPELLQDLLRGKLGFNGLIVTDARIWWVSPQKSAATILFLKCLWQAVI